MAVVARTLVTPHHCMMSGSCINILRGPAIYSGRLEVDCKCQCQLSDTALVHSHTSNQNTGNMTGTSGRSLNKYSIPATFLRRTFSWSRISTCCRDISYMRSVNEMVFLGGNRGEWLDPEDGVVSVRVWLDSVLKLLAIARICQIEVRPGDKHRGGHLTLSHVL